MARLQFCNAAPRGQASHVALCQFWRLAACSSKQQMPGRPEAAHGARFPASWSLECCGALSTRAFERMAASH